MLMSDQGTSGQHRSEGIVSMQNFKASRPRYLDGKTRMQRIEGRNPQSGMILVSALLLLAATSLIAVGLAADTTTDFQVAGNRRVQQQTFYMADGAVNLGVQVTRDFVLNWDEGLVDPQEDYPGAGVLSLSDDGTLYMKNFSMNAAHVIDDINGYTANDNDLDGTDPNELGNPADVRFDLIRDSSEGSADTAITMDLDLLAKDPWGDVKFATGYDDPVGNKWVYYYNIRARATDVSRSDSCEPNSELATVYAVLK